MRHIPTFFFCKHTWTQIILYDSVIHTVFFYDYFLPIFFLEPSRLLSLSHPLLLILLSKTLQAISILKCLFRKTKKGHLLVTTFLKACSYKKKIPKFFCSQQERHFAYKEMALIQYLLLLQLYRHFFNRAKYFPDYLHLFTHT